VISIQERLHSGFLRVHPQAIDSLLRSGHPVVSNKSFTHALKLHEFLRLVQSFDGR